ncbi:MAG: sialidase family protein [Petrimonas sp.]|jgi:hypothetical protein|nr:MAG: BNR/Asp-box repeat protein [Bacteroidetes bacterium ADurb.BinA174]
MKDKKTNRRNFLKITGFTTIGSLFVGELLSNELASYSDIIEREAGAQSRLDNKRVTIIETKLVCKEPGKYLIAGNVIDENGHVKATEPFLEPNRYLGWPTIAKTNTGELLIAYSGDRDSHVCPWGKTRLIRSKDNGKTWSEPETVNNSPLDDRDAGIIQTKKGTLLISWFTSLAYANPARKWIYQKYARVAEKIPEELKKHWLGNWTTRSEDGGKTWLTPTRTIGTAPHGPIQLRDGRLLFVGNGLGGIVVEESKDDGISWQLISKIPFPNETDTGITEPHLVELKSGKIIAMFRNEPKDRSRCFLLQSDSYDGGKTWTPMRLTNIWGYPPHLLELKNGWVLVVYGHRREPFSEKACISRDEGKTWDIENEIILSEAFNGDLGYPASIQFDDGSILTVYYQQEKEGEPTSLFTTHWKINY